MKKCPTCGKEFEDSMKFCQIDGAELVTDEPAFDPYATVVGHKIDLTSEADKPAEAPVEGIIIEPIEETPIETSVEIVAEPVIHETTGSIPIAPPDEVLELPGMDPLKTMYVSDEEMKQAFGTGEANKTLTEESIMAEPPAAGSGSMAPPPSPFSAPESPFEPPASESPRYADDAETVLAQEVIQPFKEPEPAQWTPPPVQEAAWQNQQIAANAPFQAAPPNTAGENKILPIVSLVLGILSLCCYMAPITGLAALVTGFLGLKNINNNPSVYGGKPFAIAGMVVGGLFFLVGIAYWIFLLFFGGLAAIMDAAR